MSNTTEIRSTWEHRQLAILMRRGWSAVVLGVVIGLVGGVVVTLVQPKKYTASASVFVTSTGVQDSSTIANARTTGTINLDTESRLVKSTNVAQRVQALDPSTQSLGLVKLVDGVKVVVPANTEILNIHYVATSPTVAAQRANDFATAYLAQRQADAQATLDAQIKATQTDLTTLTARLKAVSDQIGKLPRTSPLLNFVQAQRALLISQVTTLSAQQTKLTTTVVTPGRSLTKATSPRSPSSPSQILDLSAGLAVGLLLGLLIAWLRFVVRKRLRRPDDVLTKLHLPVLGSVVASGVPTLVPIASDSFQNYRRIANVITATLGESGILLVTGQCSQASAASVVANIARALARAGTPVKVTSTDSPDSAAMWAELLTRDPMMHDTWVALPDSENLHRQSLDAIRRGSLLIVTAPDPQHSADAQTVAALCDAVTIVVEARAKVDHTKVLDQLDAVGAPMLGAVLVLPGDWWHRGSTKSVQRSSVMDRPDVVPAGSTVDLTEQLLNQNSALEPSAQTGSRTGSQTMSKQAKRLQW